jgi:hypothetical protein
LAKKLRIEFFESGKGETILIHFPDGGIGIVDAHPSPTSSRPDILSLIAGREVHFVCLTHPHADHAIDLIPVIEKHEALGEFWHTCSDVEPFMFFCVTQRDNYPTPVREFVNRWWEGWADYLLNLYAGVAERDLRVRKLHADVASQTIADVELIFLAPEEPAANRFVQAYRDRVAGEKKKLPSPNILSAVIAVKYKDVVVLLGADALKSSWETAVRRYRAAKLPRAKLVKMPHHGAANAIILRPTGKQANYLDLCERSPKAYAVLFAGDSSHPAPAVHTKLQSNTTLLCLANGRKGAVDSVNPLKIHIPRARAVRPSLICNPSIEVEIDASGRVTLLAGAQCPTCA